MADSHLGVVSSEERSSDDNPWYSTPCRYRMRYVFCAFFPVAFALVLWGGMTFVGSQKTNSSESIILLAVGFLFLLLWMVAVGHYDYSQRRYGVPAKYCTLVNEGTEQNSFKSTVRILVPFAILGHAQEDSSPDRPRPVDGPGNATDQIPASARSNGDHRVQSRPRYTDTSGAELFHTVQSGVGFSEIIVRDESSVGVRPVTLHTGRSGRTVDGHINTAHSSPPPYEQAVATWHKERPAHASKC